MLLLGLFLLGLIFGSFLNAYSFRYIDKKSVWTGRSKCPHCKQELGPLDLIPLFSFLWLRGKCQYCKKSISWQYPLVELITGLLFVGVGLWLGPWQTGTSYLISLAFYLYLALVAIVVSVVDIRIQIIPDKVILPAAVFTAIFHLAQVWLGVVKLQNCWSLLLAAFGAAIFLYAVAWVGEKVFRKEAMGGGDIKLAFLLGLIVGWPGILIAFLLSFWIAAAVGIVLIATGSRKMADRIPFGPYLILGTVLALIIGAQPVLDVLIAL